MQEPISDEQAIYDGALSYPQTMFRPHEPPPWGQPYERTIGADLFQLGSLGLWAGANLSSLKSQLCKTPIPKSNPSLTICCLTPPLHP